MFFESNCVRQLLLCKLGLTTFTQVLHGVFIYVMETFNIPINSVLKVPPISDTGNYNLSRH